MNSLLTGVSYILRETKEMGNVAHNLKPKSPTVKCQTEWNLVTIISEMTKKNLNHEPNSIEM